MRGIKLVKFGTECRVGRCRIGKFWGILRRWDCGLDIDLKRRKRDEMGIMG